MLLLTLTTIPGSTTFFLSAHILSSLICLVFFSVALILNVMFLFSERQIKLKKISHIIMQFPSLKTLETLHNKTLYYSFLLLTLVIVTGATFSFSKTNQYINFSDPKQILSFICWFFFALFFNLKVKKGWQGHKGIVLSLLGFVGMLLLFIVGFK